MERALQHTKEMTVSESNSTPAEDRYEVLYSYKHEEDNWTSKIRAAFIQLRAAFFIMPFLNSSFCTFFDK